MLSSNGRFKNFVIARVALYNAGTIHKFSRLMMHEGCDDMAAITRLSDKSSTRFPICADDEDVHRNPER